LANISIAAARLRHHQVSPVLSVNLAQRLELFREYIYLEWLGWQRLV